MDYHAGKACDCHGPQRPSGGPDLQGPHKCQAHCLCWEGGVRNWVLGIDWLMEEGIICVSCGRMVWMGMLELPVPCCSSGELSSPLMKLWLLVLDALLLLLLQLLQVLQLLHLLLHDVRLRTQPAALDPLVGHHLREAGGVAVVEGRHHPVLPPRVQASLAAGSSPHGVELARLAHAAVHPGQPIALAVDGALVGETRRQRVELHPSQLLLVRHHQVVDGQVRIGHALQVVQGDGGRLLERRGHHGRRGHVGDVAVRGLQRVDRRQHAGAVQEAAGLPVLQVLLLHLHVFALLAADALGAGLARLLAVAVRHGLLHAAQVAVGRAQRRRQGGAERAAVHVGTPHQVVVVHQPHDVVVHPLLRDVSG
ncbi:hypothetical protein EYF80_029629 [Liparis tanakae]|uniref:Uncharacterized protein n=1 Tax=Liparis tanakae TaxID=230148 RepID=A0A4Z2H317_9TELE|nr:hypothetical protein EYF80_029629 [Liparis tanakae]